MFWQVDSGDDGEWPPAALRLDPNLADAHARHGRGTSEQGKFRGGAEPACCANRLDPTTYVGNRIAGLCCLGLRRYDEAIGYFEFAAAAMESDFTAATFISQCYKSKGDMERMHSPPRKAMDRIEKIVGADPGHSRAIGMGVAMLADLGEKERARRVGDAARAWSTLTP